VEAEKAGEQTN